MALKVSVEVPEPGAGSEDGAKPALTPVGRPDTEKETGAEKPFVTVEVTVTAVLPFTGRVAVAGALIAKPGGGGTAVTVKLSATAWTAPPLVPEMDNGYVPVNVLPLAVKVNVEVPEPGAGNEDGAKPALTPAGRPDTEKDIGPEKPFVTVDVTVTAVLPPTWRVAVAGALIAKSGDDVLPTT